MGSFVGSRTTQKVSYSMHFVYEDVCVQIKAVHVLQEEEFQPRLRVPHPLLAAALQKGGVSKQASKAACRILNPLT